MIYRDGNKRGKKINKNRSLFITVYAMTNQNNKDFCSISKMKSRKDTKFYSNVYNKLVKMKKEKSVIKINSINIIKSNYIAGQIKLTWGISSLGASRGNVNRTSIVRDTFEKEKRETRQMYEILLCVYCEIKEPFTTRHTLNAYSSLTHLFLTCIARYVATITRTNIVVVAFQLLVNGIFISIIIIIRICV